MKKNLFQIKEICQIRSGKRLPNGANFTTKKTDYPYIRARDIKNGRINTTELVYLEKDVQKKIKKYIIQEGDVAVTIVGASVGDVAFADNNVNGYNLTENAVRLTGFKENVNSKYIFYILYQKQFHDFMQLIAGASAQPKLGIYKIERIKVELPNIDTQNKIATILSAYDELIENNNKRIKLLEQMAENFYKEWFVRFRFPGYEEESFKKSLIGKIPQSFNVVKMKQVLLYYIGGGWGEDEKTATFSSASYVIRGTDFVDIQKGKWLQCPYRYHKESNFNSRKLKPWDIILEVSGGTQEQPVGRTLIVTPELIEYMSGKVICASFCKLLRCNEEVVSPLYFYYWMQYLYNARIIDKFQLQSTGIINFKFEYFLRKGDIMIPSKKIMSEFEHKVKEIYKLKDSLAKQNQNLVKQRDLLLPRLMSGKLEV